MAELVFLLKSVNFQLLVAELAISFPGLVEGVVWKSEKGILVIVVSDVVSSDDLIGIRGIVENHDPGQLSDRQKAIAAREKLDLFTIALADSDVWANSQVDREFKRRMTRAFVELRMMVRGE